MADDTFMGLDLAHGGHLTHGSPVNMSGINYHPVAYKLNEETGRVDYDQMEKAALEHRPKLIVGGASAYSREWDWKRMREIADEVGAIFMVDMAHPAGLIAAGLLDNPVKYAHIVTTTTHKTLRGPRGGAIIIGKDFENPWGLKTPKGQIKMVSQLINSAAKAVAFYEALQPEFKEYQLQVKKNAAAMAKAFIDRGYKIVSGGTDNHLMLIDLRTKFPDLTGKVAEKTLVRAQEHGAFRQPYSFHYLRYPRRYSCHHFQRSGGEGYGSHRRAYRRGALRCRERGCNREGQECGSCSRCRPSSERLVIKCTHFDTFYELEKN